jgi:cytochrome c6
MKHLFNMESTIKLMVILASISCISFAAITQRNETEKTGKEIFESNCVRCHGTDGTKGKWGAKNLKLSTLSDNEMLTVISDGKRVMPAWSHSLTRREIELVRDYIKTLRE